jgi:heat shock protein HtpX
MRIGLFLLTNLGVLLVASLVLKLLGVNTQSMAGLLIFAAILGFGGSLISLMLSKTIALKSTGARIIAQPSNSTERWLVETVQRQSQQAGIGMPDVAIFDAAEMNAFATGANRNKALVAVSTGLLQQMPPDEVEAVLAHEVAHVANGDMITMALLQGVLNTFVIVLSRIIASVVDNALKRDQEESSGPSFTFYIVATIMEIVLGILATMVAMWFSRRREFRADAGGASLATRDKMIAALARLKRGAPSSLPSEVAAFGISGGGASDLLKKLFLTHPPLDERIEALRRGN